MNPRERSTARLACSRSMCSIGRTVSSNPYRPGNPQRGHCRHGGPRPSPRLWRGHADPEQCSVSAATGTVVEQAQGTSSIAGAAIFGFSGGRIEHRPCPRLRCRCNEHVVQRLLFARRHTRRSRPALWICRPVRLVSVRAPVACRDYRRIPGVAVVAVRIVGHGAISIDGFDEPITGRLISLPDDGDPQVNSLALRQGQTPMPDHPGEVVVTRASRRPTVCVPAVG